MFRILAGMGATASAAVISASDQSKRNLIAAEMEESLGVEAREELDHVHDEAFHEYLSNSDDPMDKALVQHLRAAFATNSTAQNRYKMTSRFRSAMESAIAMFAPSWFTSSNHGSAGSSQSTCSSTTSGASSDSAGLSLCVYRPLGTYLTPGTSASNLTCTTQAVAQAAGNEAENKAKCIQRQQDANAYNTWRSMFGFSCGECGMYSGSTNNYLAAEGSRTGNWIPVGQSASTQAVAQRGNKASQNVGVLSCNAATCNGGAQSSFGILALQDPSNWMFRCCN